MSTLASDLYVLCVRYLEDAGWAREERGSGWWWREDEVEMKMMGEALDIQLMLDGIDLRVEPV